MENPIKMDDLGVPPFLETPRWRTFTLTLACSLVQACRESADAQAAENVILKMRDAGIERLGFLQRVGINLKKLHDSNCLGVFTFPTPHWC